MMNDLRGLRESHGETRTDSAMRLEAIRTQRQVGGCRLDGAQVHEGGSTCRMTSEHRDKRQKSVDTIMKSDGSRGERDQKKKKRKKAKATNEEEEEQEIDI